MILKKLASTAAIGLLCAATLSPSWAALKAGDAAPDFSTDAALAGAASKFSLAQSLKGGPVVLYFYPKAFTTGCTIEAHNFAEATPKFNALGATVVGISNDDIDTLKKFSVEACRNKFAVLADGGGQITKKYDAVLAARPDLSDRISYVIAPDGKVIYAFSSLDPDKHVENTLHAVEQWKAAQRK
jgi:thioredoxin-dependent peroxiredoxin